MLEMGNIINSDLCTSPDVKGHTSILTAGCFNKTRFIMQFVSIIGVLLNYFRCLKIDGMKH